MTTNVLLNETGTEPLRIEGEYFNLRRNDISYRISIGDNVQYTGEGYLILTSNRLVIIPTKQNTNFRAIEIPLNQIYQEEFKQPIFGKNYLTAKCNRMPSSQFDNFTFTIWLKGNRMGTLIGALYTLLDSLRNNQGRHHDEKVIRCLQNNYFNELFAIDLEDNSLIYQIQPASANIPRQNFQSVIINRLPGLNNFIGRNNNVNQQNNNNNINDNININNERNNNNNIQSNIENMPNNNNNNIYMSTFNYRNPKPNSFVYKDPGFVYRPPINSNNNANDDDDLESPYIPKDNNKNNNRSRNNFNNNINIINNNVNRNNINIQNPYMMKNNMSNNYIQNPYVMRNNMNNNYIQNPYMMRNNINNINYPPKYNNNKQMSNQPYMNNQNQNQSGGQYNKMNLNQNNNNNNFNNNRNIPMNNSNQMNNQYNNPYAQIKNNPFVEDKKDEKINKNIINNRLYKVEKGSGKYQNLKEEENENPDNSINNVSYSINDGENSERFNLYLDSNQDQNLLNRLNSDDLIPDSKVENPYN